MNQKKWTLLCVAALLAGCSQNTTDYSGQTLYGRITKLYDKDMTVLLGEVEETENADMSQGMQMPEGEQTPPDLPDSNNENADSDFTINEGGQDMQTPEGAQTPPDKPEGETPPEMPDSNNENGDSDFTINEGGQDMQMPDMPEGEMPEGEMPADMPGVMPGGDMSSNSWITFTAGEDSATFSLSSAEIYENESAISLSDLTVGDVVSIVVGDDNTVTSVTILKAEDVTAENLIVENSSITGADYSSTGDDENALCIQGAVVELDDIAVDKSAGSSSNTENGDFYGVNAALLCEDGAQVTIKNSTITSSAQNGNGVFSYGTGTSVTISDSVITTTKDNSGGIQTTGGATTNASNLTIETSGSSSAAIRSDRGGGTVIVDSGSYTTHGLNSPAVYSTADITVKNADLTAENSEALVIEGANSLSLIDCSVSGNMSEKSSSADENLHGIMIYQSMSGDAQEGTAAFAMTNGSLETSTDDLIYVTNTHCTIDLDDVALSHTGSGYLLRIAGNSGSKGWGKQGSNGGSADMTWKNQTAKGNIYVDSISSLNFTLADSTWEGAFEGEGDINVVLEEGSTWTLTEDASITSYSGKGTLNLNGHTLTLADGTVLK